MNLSGRIPLLHEAHQVPHALDACHHWLRELHRARWPTRRALQADFPGALLLPAKLVIFPILGEDFAALVVLCHQRQTASVLAAGPLSALLQHSALSAHRDLLAS
ncbi:type II toxin-antitoxin system HigB family toxin [Roseibacillus ishigakijimensis]|uniref:Type II toxin-antitoxin system HigB family toxin n=1 Tax=Roseibacillus ishigakijimensis TaxID=454146 RepID=A0A934VHV7_9BACT|nr:type II toxin-antitoxin system HigB family toxin [Roseibacillus ishigakijimensis]MBK1834393.1 type II toxin-antitoxin system HigB family toxin [Roseibacillus ishigakijimensis]